MELEPFWQYIWTLRGLSTFQSKIWSFSAIIGVKNTLVYPSIFSFLDVILNEVMIFYPIILMSFLIKFLIFSPKNRFSRQKVQKNWKSKNGVKTALTPLFKELWAIFGFVKFKNQISPPEKSKKLRGFANFQ